MTSKPAPSPAAPEALGRVLLPLRAFLGFTFCFAGLQKLANPQFFDAADSASIRELRCPDRLAAAYGAAAVTCGGWRSDQGRTPAFSPPRLAPPGRCA